MLYSGQNAEEQWEQQTGHTLTKLLPPRHPKRCTKPPIMPPNYRPTVISYIVKLELWCSNHLSMVRSTNWGSALQSLSLLMEAKLSQLRKSQISMASSRNVSCQVQFLLDASYNSSWSAHNCPFISSVQGVVGLPSRGL